MEPCQGCFNAPGCFNWIAKSSHFPVCHPPQPSAFTHCHGHATSPRAETHGLPPSPWMVTIRLHCRAKNGAPAVTCKGMPRHQKEMFYRVPLRRGCCQPARWGSCHPSIGSWRESVSQRETCMHLCCAGPHAKKCIRTEHFFCRRRWTRSNPQMFSWFPDLKAEVDPALTPGKKKTFLAFCFRS